MKKPEKIGLLIVVILAVVFAVSIWQKPKNKIDEKTYAKISCQSLCHPYEQNYWIFPGAGENNYFLTKEDCVLACIEKGK